MYNVAHSNTATPLLIVKTGASQIVALAGLTFQVNGASSQRTRLQRSSLGSESGPSAITPGLSNTRSPAAAATYYQGATSVTDAGSALLSWANSANLSTVIVWWPPRPWAMPQLEVSEEFALKLRGTNNFGGFTAHLSEGDATHVLRPVSRPTRNGLWHMRGVRGASHSGSALITCYRWSTDIGWVAQTPAESGVRSNTSFALLDAQLTPAPYPASIESAESFGIPTITEVYDQIAGVESIASEEVLGVPTVSASGVFDIAPAGIASAGAFGTPQVNLSIPLTSIATAEAFGAPLITLRVTPTGVASAGVFGSPTVTLAAPFDQFTIKLKDPPSGHVAMAAVGHILRAKAFNGTAVVDNWLRVMAAPDTSASGYISYPVAIMSGTPGILPAGTTIVNYGPDTGSGFITLTSDAANAPYIDVSTHPGTPWSVITPRVRMGQLAGVLGLGAQWGIAMGTDLSDNTQPFIIASDQQLLLSNVSLKVNGTQGFIALGNPPPTSSSAGTGMFIDRTGLYGLQANVQQVKIDTADGKLYATGGQIGGWSLDTDSIDSTGISLVSGASAHTSYFDGATEVVRQSALGIAVRAQDVTESSLIRFYETLPATNLLGEFYTALWSAWGGVITVIKAKAPSGQKGAVQLIADKPGDPGVGSQVWLQWQSATATDFGVSLDNSSGPVFTVTSNSGVVSSQMLGKFKVYHPTSTDFEALVLDTEETGTVANVKSVLRLSGKTNDPQWESQVVWDNANTRADWRVNYIETGGVGNKADVIRAYKTGLVKIPDLLSTTTSIGTLSVTGSGTVDVDLDVIGDLFADRMFSYGTGVVESLNTITNPNSSGISSGGIVFAYTYLPPNGANQRLGVIGGGVIYSGSTYRTAAISFRSAQSWSMGTQMGTNIVFETTANGTAPAVRPQRMIIDHDGRVGIGTRSDGSWVVPQGLLHGFDTLGGFLYWEYDGVDATVRTVIPDGAGDAVYGVRVMAAIRDSTGAFVSNNYSLATPTDQAITTSGANVINIRVNANGSVDVRRSAGTATFKITMWLIWL